MHCIVLGEVNCEVHCAVLYTDKDKPHLKALQGTLQGDISKFATQRQGAWCNTPYEQRANDEQLRWVHNCSAGAPKCKLRRRLSSNVPLFVLRQGADQTTK